MDTPRPTGDRVPLGDLTNTTHEGNHTRLELVQLDGDANGQKRLRERELYATTSDENSSGKNKRLRKWGTTDKMSENSDRLHVHSAYNNGAEQLSDGNTINESDENSDWLHRQSSYCNSLQQLSDGPVPLSTIGGIGDVHNIDTEEGLGNRLVTCSKEHKRDYDRARNAAMSPEQRALLNKRRRELYATKKAPKKSTRMLQMTPNETAQSTSAPIPLTIGVPGDIEQYRDARWVTPPEALWRIYGFDLSKNHPPVQQLQLHLPDMHMVAFHKRDKVERIVNRPGVEESMLTAYFEANKNHEEARGILYRDFPEHFTWQSDGKFWQKRKNSVFQVGRIISAHPAEGERYFLRVLLNNVAGATSYEHLRTVDGILLPSFREAAERRGLIEEDNTLDECLTEATLFQMPSSLRRLFATILVFCEPHNVMGLWKKHYDAMSEDYSRNNPSPDLVQQMVLIDIRNMLQSMGKDIKVFPLPDIDHSYDDASHIPREIFEEASVEQNPKDVLLCDSLNTEQRSAYDEIMAAVCSKQGGLFFVDGPGGTGKTFLYRALIAKLRSQDKLVVATATSGVAASIMPGGRTAHSRFKIPLTLQEDGCCTFTKQSGTAKLLQQAALIIWDEASMTKRQNVEALDNSLRDIMGRSHLPFGGKTVVLGGDFRQVLLVVRKGSRAQIVGASLRRSYLWESVRHLKLVRNMRAQSDPWFADYLLRIGGGTEEVNGDGNVRIPDEICVPYSGDAEKDLHTLIDIIFPDLNKNMADKDYITTRAILSTRNDWVDMINMKMIDMFQGGETVYHSFDSAVDDPHNYYPSEFLNSLTPNGLPPHVLKLKLGCPVILLRNIDPANGLCNGTRLVVRGFRRNTIDAEIVVGQHAGKRVFLPRIPLCPSDDEMFPFQFKRKQFPIRLSFAMTVNKSQGQTIPNVGVYLPAPVFSHGQLYVAMSRATSRTNIKILALPPDGDAQEEKAKKMDKKNAKRNAERKKPKNTSNKKDKDKKIPTTDGIFTKNIVFKEVLTP